MRDEIRRDNLSRIHASRFRNLFAEPMPWSTQLALGCLSLAAALVVGLAIAWLLGPQVVK